MKGYLLVVLISNFLIVNDIEHPFILIRASWVTHIGNTMEIMQFLREGQGKILLHPKMTSERRQSWCSVIQRRTKKNQEGDVLSPLLSQLRLKRLLSLSGLKEEGSFSKWKVALRGKVVTIVKYLIVLWLLHLTLLETSFMNKAKNSSGALVSLRQNYLVFKALVPCFLLSSPFLWAQIGN